MAHHPEWTMEKRATERTHFIVRLPGTNGSATTGSMGYGREAYVWSMIAAFGLFTAGAVVSVMHGVQKLFTPEPAGDYAIAYVVLAICTRSQGPRFRTL
jgi:hypothetical protein